MQRFTIILLVLFITLNNSYSQKNTFKGYFVDNDGDTVNCFIKRISSEYNPSRFLYKTDSAKSSFQTKAIDEVKSFGIYGGDDYERHSTNMNTAFTDLENIGHNPEIERKVTTVFLKTYQFNEGIKFFVYREKSKERFFLMQKNDTIPYELEYHIYYLSKGSTEVIKKEGYKKQLEDLANQYTTEGTKARERLSYMRYDEELILRFLETFIGDHTNSISPSASQLKVINKVEFRYFVVGGVNNHQYNANGLKGIGRKFTGVASAGIDLITDRIENRFFIRAELGISPMGFKNKSLLTEFGQVVSVERKLRNNFVFITPTFNFKIYDGDKTKIFTGIGIGYTISILTRYIEKRSDIPNDNYFLRKGTYDGIHFQAGINAIINNRIVISTDYTAIAISSLYNVSFIGMKAGWILK
jgi:hypothetical protein